MSRHQPWTMGMSRANTAATTSCPSPWREKRDSTTTLPPSSRPNWRSHERDDGDQGVPEGVAVDDRALGEPSRGPSGR